MLSKSRIFYFSLIFIIALLVGFFAFDAAMNFGNNFLNQIASYAGKINATIFTASVFQDSVGTEIILPDKEAEQSSLTDETLVVESHPVVAAPAEDVQDQLDDIQEKLDVISQQVQELVAQQKPNNQVVETDKEKNLDDQNENNQNQNEQPAEAAQTLACTGQIDINTASEESLDKIIGVGPATAQKIIGNRPFYSLNDLLIVNGIGTITLQKIIDQGCAYVDSVPSGVGGGGFVSAPAQAPAVYPKILISEVQIAPIARRFVELYNPNNMDVDLTGWYLQRKTSDSWNSFISAPKFAGKIIPANGYFLISRSDATADILFDLTLTPGNFLAIKNPDEKISDEMSFTDVEANKSIGRKILDDKTEQDTNDDAADFELDTPTPKSQNIAYFAPLPPPPPILEDIAITTSPAKTEYLVGDVLDISGLAVFGIYSDRSQKQIDNSLLNITGFDTTSPATNQVLTINFEEKTTSYQINISTAPQTPPESPVDTTAPSVDNYAFNGVAQNITINPITHPVQIDLTANENVNWMYVRVVNVSDPSIYKTFGSGAGCVDGTSVCSKSWNGGISHGTALIDGDYKIKVHIKDAANKEFNDYLAPYIITVDTTLP